MTYKRFKRILMSHGCNRNDINEIRMFYVRNMSFSYSNVLNAIEEIGRGVLESYERL